MRLPCLAAFGLLAVSPPAWADAWYEQLIATCDRDAARVVIDYHGSWRDSDLESLPQEPVMSEDGAVFQVPLLNQRHTFGQEGNGRRLSAHVRTSQDFVCEIGEKQPKSRIQKTAYARVSAWREWRDFNRRCGGAPAIHLRYLSSGLDSLGPVWDELEVTKDCHDYEAETVTRIVFDLETGEVETTKQRRCELRDDCRNP